MNLNYGTIILNGESCRLRDFREHLLHIILPPRLGWINALSLIEARITFNTHKFEVCRDYVKDRMENGLTPQPFI